MIESTVNKMIREIEEAMNCENGCKSCVNLKVAIQKILDTNKCGTCKKPLPDKCYGAQGIEGAFCSSQCLETACNLHDKNIDPLCAECIDNDCSARYNRSEDEHNYDYRKDGKYDCHVDKKGEKDEG